MRRPVREVGGRIDAGECAEIVNEMRLIEVAAIQRDVSPFDALAAFHAVQRPVEAPDTAKHFGRESSLIAKHLNEALGAETDLFAHRRHGCHVRSGHEAAERESYGAMLMEAPRQFGQQRLLQNLEAKLMRRSLQQLIPQNRSPPCPTARRAKQ